MISYIYSALNVFTGSNQALYKMILEMIKYFTHPHLLQTSHFRGKSVTQKYRHHDYLQSVWVYHHLYCPPKQVSDLSSSCQALKMRERLLKINKALVPHFLSLLPAVLHPLFMLPANLPALSVKVWVRTPMKVKKALVYYKKLSLDLF